MNTISSRNNHTIRVLHAIGGLNRGGSQTWMMHVLRNIDRDQFQIDFLLYGKSPDARGHYEEEAQTLGAKIIRIRAQHKKQRAFCKELRQRLQQEVPYDIVHAHTGWFSGIILRECKRMGIPVRIQHIHNDFTHEKQQSGFFRSMQIGYMGYLLKRNATHSLACSGIAGDSVLGLGWQDAEQQRVLFCGVDLKPFEVCDDAEAVRQELGVADSSLVIGSVGRFKPQKNHHFILDIMVEVLKRKPDAKLLLVGMGTLENEIKEKAKSIGLEHSVLFAGVRSDVPRLMKSAMDVYLMPSFHEGMPLVGVEAQAAGLPCFLSDVISEETNIVSALMNRLSLDDSPERWADAILNVDWSALPSPEESLEIVKRSPFNIDISVKELVSFYEITSCFPLTDLSTNASFR